ncbi:hypothetical protein N7G274_002800 [Stereocaulon virgatum]|uniref:DNL-type domain-containing protein n=1 Tax=Stereocaulon virgatum TaxID=373712 RepID=A0ABR4AHU8_9LECA
MKADQAFSTVSRQLRPSLARARTQPSPLRSFSKLAATDYPTLSRAQRISTHPRRISLPNSYSIQPLQIRHQSDSADTVASSDPEAPASPTATPSEKPPSYRITFTCKPCLNRSTHIISKQGYHNGTVLITCSRCNNRHVISDHLKIFADQSFTLEELLQQKGELVNRGRLEGDVEFWDDGTEVERGEKERELLELSQERGEE